MCPTFPINDSAYLASVNSESSGQQRDCLTSRSMKLPYLFNIFFRQLALATALLASGTTVSPFGDHVSVVVSCGAQEQVCRVATWPIVATMTNEHPVWNSAFIRKHPCVPVSVFGFELRAKAESSVPGHEKSACPRPALVSRPFGYPFPESDLRRYFRTWHDLVMMYTLRFPVNAV